MERGAARGGRGGGVFERHDRSDHTRKQAAVSAPGDARMTAVDVLGRVDELADGTGGSGDAVTGGGDPAVSQIPVS